MAERIQRLEKRAALKASQEALKEPQGELKKNEAEGIQREERDKLRERVGETSEEKTAREERIIRGIKDDQAKRITENKRKPRRHFEFEAQEKDYNVDFGRKMIVLPLPSRGLWFDNTKIAFFKSTGTSNEGFEFLEGTYFPTLGIINKSDTRTGNIPFIDKLAGDGTVAVKTNFFKTLFTGKSREMSNTPVWLYDLITEYCEERYPTLFDIDYGKFRVDESNMEMALEQEKQLIEIEHLQRILKTYFTADWQVAQSIGLSRFMSEGIWIGEMQHFAEFMDTKIQFTLSGYRGPEVEGEGNIAKAIKFLQDNDAQSGLQFTEEDALETSLTTPSEYYLFSGTSLNRLQQDMRAYHNAARFKRKGGLSKTKRQKRRSIKTRRQKRR
jgi:hypothetical protein